MGHLSRCGLSSVTFLPWGGGSWEAKPCAGKDSADPKAVEESMALLLAAMVLYLSFLFCLSCPAGCLRE